MNFSYGFMYDHLPPLCSTEVLSPSEHTAQLQRSEILEECEQGRNCCYTLKSVEKIMKKVRKFNTNRAYILRTAVSTGFS